MSQSQDFLLALFGDYDGHVRFDDAGVALIKDVRDGDFDTVEGYLEDGKIAFLFTVVDVTGDVEDAIDHEIKQQPPTAILRSKKSLICVYALTSPAPAAGVEHVAEALGMDGTSEPIPMPGDRWALVYLDDRNHYKPADLMPPPWETHDSAPPAALGTYADAKVIAPFDETDPVLEQTVVVSLGRDQFSKQWKPKEMPLGALVAMFCQHKEGPKEGPGMVLGEQVPGQRVKSAVKAMYAVGLDLDDGVPSAAVDKALTTLGCLGLRYTTHSHLKSQSKYPRDALVKWANKYADGAEVDDDLVRRYMTEKGKIDTRIVETAQIVDTVHETSGLMILVGHDPIPKHRLVIPLKKPFVIAKQGGSQGEAQDKWKKIVRKVGELLALPIDESCLDVSRLFYLPRHDKGKPFEVSLAGGPLFDFATLDLAANVWEEEIQALSKGKSKSTTDAGKQLGRWSMKAAHGFQIVQILEEHAPERMRNQTSTGWEIECPFDEEHSNPGDQDDRACLAVNAGDGPSEIFTISCRHESCRERTNLDMLGKMVEDRWFSEEVLNDDAYNIAELEDAPDVEAAVRIDREDKAKAGWQQAIEALTKSSGEEEIGAAIRTAVEATLGAIEMERAKDLLVAQTGLKVSALSKKIKEIEKEYAREVNEAKGAKDPYGRIIFSYQGEPHFDEAYDICFKALKKENRDNKKPVFCCVQDQAVRLTEDLSGKVTFQDMTARSMWAELNDHCTFIRLTDSGAAGPRQQVPTDVASHVYEQAYKRLPQAPEIVYTPLFVQSRFGVELISQPGYYEDLDLLMADTDFRVPEVFPDPTPKEVDDALDLLAFEVLGDFPFLDHDLNGEERRESSLANALSMMLTPFMRRLIDGCTPVFFITKPLPGTGGTALGQIPIVLCDGEEPAPEPYTQNEEEMRKALLASIMETRSHLFYDDVRDFNNRVLLQSITARHIGGRLLGATKTVQRPNRFNWIATGNNPNVMSEMERRVVWIRLNAKTDDIQNRTFRHPDLMPWLKRERSNIVHAILTLIQYWVSLGMPKFQDRKRASFEDWAEKVGGVLMCADRDDHYGLQHGFLNNRRAQGADTDEAAVRTFVREWFDRWGLQHVTPAELFAFALDGEMDICDGNNDDQKKSRFYRRLPLLEGRTFVLKEKKHMVRMGTNSEGDTTYHMELVVETVDA